MPLFATLLSLAPDERFPPLGLPPVREREETFRALVDWLRAYSGRRPVLFVVEDLHWADASTLEFLQQFLAGAAHERILTVLTFRPEFQPPWPTAAHQTALALTSLTQRQVADLMAKKTESAVPETLAEQVYARTGGVPLFVEEYTRMLQDSGTFDSAAGGAAPLPSALPREIPSTPAGPGHGEAGSAGGRPRSRPDRGDAGPRVQLRAAGRRRGRGRSLSPGRAGQAGPGRHPVSQGSPSPVPLRLQARPPGRGAVQLAGQGEEAGLPPEDRRSPGGREDSNRWRRRRS